MISTSLEYGHEIAQGAGAVFNPVVDTVIARTNEGRLLGGVIYQGYTHASIEMHVYGKTPLWLSLPLLGTFFHYPFVQLGCVKVFAPVKPGNTHAIRFVQKVGFVLEHLIEDVYPEGPLALFAMKREACRWTRFAPVKDILDG